MAKGLVKKLHLFHFHLLEIVDFFFSVRGGGRRVLKRHQRLGFLGNLFHFLLLYSAGFYAVSNNRTGFALL